MLAYLCMLTVFGIFGNKWESSNDDDHDDETDDDDSTQNTVV